MSQKYACMNYGACASAGDAVIGVDGVVPSCPGCGLPMAAQGRARRGTGIATAIRSIGICVGGLIVVFVVWQSSIWGYHKAVGYDIKGRWRAEATSLLGVALPVGLNLEFDETSARLLDRQVQVVEYERNGNRVYVVLQADAGAQVNLEFVFADQDHMVFEGPMGFSMRYRRVRSEK